MGLTAHDFCDGQLGCWVEFHKERSKSRPQVSYTEYCTVSPYRDDESWHKPAVTFLAAEADRGKDVVRLNPAVAGQTALITSRPIPHSCALFLF